MLDLGRFDSEYGTNELDSEKLGPEGCAAEGIDFVIFDAVFDLSKLEFNVSEIFVLKTTT